jgi:hypothetical protein
MKQVTMDWETYRQEKDQNEARGYRHGLAEARRIVVELLAGSSIEHLDIADDEQLYNLAQDLKPRIDAKKARAA